jgi:preprotein translocase subunit SecY
VLIVLFTFFYTYIVFSPEKLAETIQKRGWYIPWIRPWEETAKYISNVLLHLCFWWGLGLGFIGVYTYILAYIPIVQQAIASIGTLPVVVSWAGIIIIVGVVQEIINKLNAELLMERYDRI